MAHIHVRIVLPSSIFVAIALSQIRCPVLQLIFAKLIFKIGVFKY